MFEQRLTNLDNPNQYHMVSDQHGDIAEQVTAIQEKWGTTNTELGPVIDLTAIDRKLLRDAMQRRINNQMEALWDRNERERMAGWKIEGKALTEIDATTAWADMVWHQYDLAAERIMAGEEGVEDPEIPPRPYTWDQVKAAALSGQ